MTYKNIFLTSKASLTNTKAIQSEKKYFSEDMEKDKFQRNMKTLEIDVV